MNALTKPFYTIEIPYFVKGWPNNEMNVFPVALGVGLSQLLLEFIRNRSLVKVYSSMGLKRNVFKE